MTETAIQERTAAEPAAGTPLVLTGIDGLDELLGGGVPRGHTVTVLGSFGTGKTTFGIQFLVQGLINQERGIFISSRRTPTPSSRARRASARTSATRSRESALPSGTSRPRARETRPRTS